jgi:ubiquitin-activating enzyme E1
MIGIKNIKITDPDYIEETNLSRQFLFRDEDRGKSKSKIAANKIIYYNDDMMIESFEDKLSEQNNINSEKFFNDVDIIFTALDNIEARLYVNQQCIKYKKPLFDSGTLGVKGNVQPIIPFELETYSSSKDYMNNEDDYPVCTLKYFPTLLEHTIHYALNDFNYLFNCVPTILKNNNKSKIDENIINIINRLNNIKSFDDYIRWAYNLWNERFNILIVETLEKYKDNEKIKNKPKINDMYLDRELFLQYMNCTIKLLVKTYSFKNIVYNEKIDLNTFDYSNSYINIVSSNDLLTDIDINIQEFEKDDITNNHINYIVATANNRANNYNIPLGTYNQIRGIAGKIIPALITTTSLVASYGILEMLKYINKLKYKSTYINLAENLFIEVEPMKAKEYLVKNKVINEWTILEYNSKIKIKDLIEDIFNKYDVNISMISYNEQIIYSIFNDDDVNITFEKLFNKYSIVSDKIVLSVSLDEDIEQFPNIIIYN